MSIIKRAAVMMLVVAAFLLAGCEEKEKEDVAEYRAENLALYDGDDYIERYLLYEENSVYERYVGGTYQGEHLSGPHWGTLFETGTYIVNEQSALIRFYPKKQYDFETKNLKSLGIEGQAKYYDGTLTAATLTITWDVWLNHFEKRELPIIYTRQ